MNYEELEKHSLLRVNQEEDDDEEITIEDAVARTGKDGFGYFQVFALVLCSMALSSQTLIFNFFALFTHKPTIFCETQEGEWVSCDVDDYCDNVNDTFIGYEIDWSKESNDGTVKNWVTEYDLVCDNDWYLSLIVSIYFAGTIAGAFFVNWCAEVWGRKPVLVVSLTFQTFALLLMVLWTSEKISLGISLFILGVNFSAQSQVSTVFLLELTSLHYKSIFSNILQLITHLWFLPLIAISYYTKDIIICLWLTIILTILLLLGFVFFTVESPRYLFAHAKVDETLETLEYMMKFNRKPIVPINLHIEAMRDGILVSSVSMSVDLPPPSPSKKYNPFMELFSSRKALSVTTSMAFLWGSVNFSYYGVAVNADQMRGSIFTVLLIIGVATTAGNFFVLFMGEMMKRRTLFGGGNVLFVISFIVYYGVGETSQIVSEIALLLGIFGITVVFTLVYLITAEIFPTYVRSTAFGFVNVVGKIFVFTIPAWVNLLEEDTVLLYILGGVASIILTIPMEETKGLPLREDWILPDEIITRSLGLTQ